VSSGHPLGWLEIAAKGGTTMSTGTSEKRAVNTLAAKQEKTGGKLESKNAVSTNSGVKTGRPAALNPPVNQQPAAKNAAKSVKPIRWAHPLFTTTPKDELVAVPAISVPRGIRN
jgi:hypothetical protein